MKDYNRYLVAISYTSGRTFAMWVYGMTVSERNMSWNDGAECPYSGALKYDIEEKLREDKITLCDSTLKIGMDSIESVWIVHRYTGKDGRKSNDA